MLIRLPCLWLILIILILDFSSKQWVITHLYLGESIPVIPFINFTYTYNPGVAFSVLADGKGWQRWLFSVIAIVMIIILLLIITERLSKHIGRSNAAYEMIIGGALGNLFDRVVHGVVIDFIDFYIGNWHWPIFNVADISICIGAVFVILEEFYRSNGKFGSVN